LILKNLTNNYIVKTIIGITKFGHKNGTLLWAHMCMHFLNMHNIILIGDDIIILLS